MPSPLAYPTIAVGPPPDWAPFDRALRSAGPVARRLDRVHQPLGGPPSRRRAARSRGGFAATLAGARIAAVGTRHRARPRRREGLRGAPGSARPAISARRVWWRGLAAGPPAGRRPRVLFPQALGGREHLREALAARGIARGRGAGFADHRAATPLPALPAFDAALFASPSALRALVTPWTADAARPRKRSRSSARPPPAGPRTAGVALDRRRRHPHPWSPGAALAARHLRAQLPDGSAPSMAP